MINEPQRADVGWALPTLRAVRQATRLPHRCETGTGKPQAQKPVWQKALILYHYPILEL